MASVCFIVGWRRVLVGHRCECEYEMKVKDMRKRKIRVVAEDSGENEVYRRQVHKVGAELSCVDIVLGTETDTR